MGFPVVQSNPVAGYVCTLQDFVTVNGEPPLNLSGATLVLLAPDGTRTTSAATVLDAPTGELQVTFMPSIAGQYWRSYILSFSDGKAPCQTAPQYSFWIDAAF